MKFKPHSYQSRAIQHILETPGAGLFLDMGMGKTVSTLTAIDTLMYDRFEVERVLVIAPKRVAEDTWTGEASKWDHLKHLRISKILGSVLDRVNGCAADADVYIINRENVEWLVRTYGSCWKWDMVVIDELSSFKNPRAKRFKSLRTVRPQIRRLVGLTGTPAPNGLMDLWSEVWLMDMGKRLGLTLGWYRDTFFTPGRRNGAVVYDYRPKRGAEEAITERISDICISMTAEDYLQLPEMLVNDCVISQTEKEQENYKNFEREQVLELDGETITATTAATLIGKLQQFTGGAIYDPEGNYHEVSEAKMETLRELVEQSDGSVIVYYYFTSELKRIKEALKEFKPEEIGGSESIARWNAGEIRVLLAHPASAGHGLNLQRGGHTIIWYTLPWSCELYQQANARLHRQGQEKPVMVYRLVMDGTVDHRVIKALENKETVQDGVMDAVKAIINEHF